MFWIWIYGAGIVGFVIGFFAYAVLRAGRKEKMVTFTEAEIVLEAAKKFRLMVDTGVCFQKHSVWLGPVLWSETMPRKAGRSVLTALDRKLLKHIPDLYMSAIDWPGVDTKTATLVKGAAPRIPKDD